jgi:transposase InsO family protein
MNPWRAGCAETCKSGSEGGPRKRTGRNPDTAPRPDPYTEHPTREGKLYCCAVLDAHSRRVVGWSIDSRQATSLVTSALGMAVKNRKPTTGTIIHSDHGSQFTSWAFSERIKTAGLTLSMGSIGDAYGCDDVRAVVSV